MQVDTYQDKEGKNKYNNYVLVEELEFLESKKEKSNSNDPYKEFGEVVDELQEELPF